MDGLHLSCWSSWTAGPIAEGCLIAIGFGVRQGRQTSSFTAVDAVNRRVNYTKQTNVAQAKELVLNAITLAKWPQEIRTTETEILCRNKTPEQGEAARIKSRDVSSSEQAGRNSRAGKSDNQVVAEN